MLERFTSAGVPDEMVTTERDTYTFQYPGTPSEFLTLFRTYYGPTMNAFEAAEKSSRGEELSRELEVLFNSQNQSHRLDTTHIPATFLRVIAEV